VPNPQCTARASPIAGRKTSPRISLSGLWDVLFPDNREWTTRAACRGSDQFMFVPESTNNRGKTREDQIALMDVKARAFAICTGCGVRPECLVDFLESPLRDFKHAVVAGLTFKERKRVREALLTGALVDRAAELLEGWQNEADVRRFVATIPLLQPRRPFRNRGKLPPEEESSPGE
jgi:hypothetical protein